MKKNNNLPKHKERQIESLNYQVDLECMYIMLLSKYSRIEIGRPNKSSLFNKQFLKIEEERKREKQINTEYKNKILNHTLKTFTFSKIIFIIPIIIFFISVIVAIIFIAKQFKSFDNVTENNVSVFEDITNIIDEEIKNNIKENDNSFTEVIVGLDEFGQTEKYKVKITKYEVVPDKFNRLEEGYEYVKFYLIVENLLNEEIVKEDTYCIVDGISQTNYMSSGYSDLPMFIAKGLTVKGEATFEVPINATSYDIKYGDYITIHIEK